MVRFVVLQHDWPTLHWDLLVQAGAVLRAWRLYDQPAAGSVIGAEPNTDHRLMYLDYEGPVSGQRGTVSRWDQGECVWLQDTAERVEIELKGKKLLGRAVLWPSSDGRWRFQLTAATG
ncbi:MAG: DNA polymerase ligase N-terminal domain-containing protein [Gemmataceae bacterium]|nr:hypothetical protein [Gemmata sp.]MDW8196709.1 DNA polymerase ligase N-terminal domain-containing protein [Gemmataceae bacterium]